MAWERLNGKGLQKGGNCNCGCIQEGVLEATFNADHESHGGHCSCICDPDKTTDSSLVGAMGLF